MRRRWYQIIMLFGSMVVLTGCSLFSFPGDRYVRAWMDAYYKEESDDYRTITGISQKDTEKQYEEAVHQQADAYLSYFGLDSISDEAQESLESFVKMVYDYASYDVTDVKRTENEQTVMVRIRPIAFYEFASQEIDDYEQRFRNKTEDGAFLHSDETAYQSAYLEGLLEIYEKQLDKITYLDEKEYTIMLHKSGKQYVMDEEQIQAVDEAILSFQKDN